MYSYFAVGDEKLSKEIVVYTAITGSYDSLSSVKEEEGIDYIVFTDQDFLELYPSHGSIFAYLLRG